MRRILSTLTQLVFCLSWFAIPFASFASSIPDEIDRAKYEDIYLQAKAQSDNLRADANRYKNQAEEFDRQLYRSRSQLSEQEAEIDRNARQIRDLDYENSRLSSDISSLQTQVREHERIANQISYDYQVLQREQSQIQSNISASKTRISQLQNKRDTAERNLRSTQQQIQSQEQELQRVRSEIQRLDSIADKTDQQKARLQQLRGQEASLNSALRTARSERDRFKNQRDEFQHKLNREEQELAQEEQRLQNTKARMAELQRNYNYQIAEMRRKESLISDANRQISSNNDDIDRMRRKNSDLENSNSSLRRRIVALQGDSERAWSDYRVADSRAIPYEQDTAQKYAKYRAVVAEYDRRLIAAIEQGKTQGEAHGSEDGTEKASVDGENDGIEVGKVDGTRDGLQDGYDRGQRTGMDTGKDDGYNHGRNLPENYQAGYAPGLIQGGSNALSEAKRIDYPKGRADKRAALLAKLPSKVVYLDNRQARAAAQDSLGISRSSNEISLSTLFTGAELRASNKPISRYNCEVGYEDFVQACHDSYQKNYQNSYEMAYNAEYNRVFKIHYDIHYAEQFEAHKELRYDEGYQDGYAAAYAKWDAIGADEARQEGYQNGLKDGYDNNIGEARKVEYTRGEEEESQFFKDNPVVKLLRAELVRVNTNRSGSDIAAGDTVALRLTFANYGQKGTIKGQVKISVSNPSGNIALDTSAPKLVSIPGSTRAIISYVVTGKVFTQVGEGDDLSLRVRAEMPDGQQQSEEVSQKAKLIVIASTRIGMSSTPEVYMGGGVFKVKKKHDISVTVSNPVRQTAKQDVTVKVTLPAGTEYKTGNHISAGKLGPGASNTLKFSYKFLNESVIGKRLPVKIDVYYGSLLTSTQTLSIVPTHH